MKHVLRARLGVLAIAAAAAAAVQAQALDEVESPVPRVERAGPVEYVNGGAGEESRASIDQLRAFFPVRNVFSGRGGQYVVAERVTVRGALDAPVEIRNAGPILVMNLPRGDYTLEVEVGGQVQRKQLRIGDQPPQQLNWHWPGA